MWRLRRGSAAPGCSVGSSGGRCASCSAKAQARGNKFLPGQHLRHQPQLLRLARIERLSGQQKISAAVESEQQGVDDVHAVARNQAVREMRRILKGYVLCRQHNVAQQGEFGMAQGGPLMALIIGTSMSSRFINRCFPSQYVWSHSRGVRLAGRLACLRTGKGVARAGHDHHLVVGVAANRETLQEIRRAAGCPTAAGRHWCGTSAEDAVSPFHADRLILLGILLKGCHNDCSPGAGIEATGSCTRVSTSHGLSGYVHVPAHVGARGNWRAPHRTVLPL